MTHSPTHWSVMIALMAGGPLLGAFLGGDRGLLLGSAVGLLASICLQMMRRHKQKTATQR